MARQKRAVEGQVSVDGDGYRWSLRREPQWSAAHGWVGLVITVEPAEEPRKLLVIEYPMPEDWKPVGPMGHRIQRPPIESGDFPAQIAAALEAGWDPASRGKPFVFVVGIGGMIRRR